jgi:cytochrome c553
MLGSVASAQKNLGAPLQSRKAMLETLYRHLDMVRLSAAGIAMIAMIGCTGLVDGGSDGKTKEQRAALDAWQKSALPVLRQNCETCHNGSREMVGFLIGGTDDMAVHDSLMNYTPTVVNLDATSSSRILNKGLHEGPQLTSDQLSSLLLWIQAERDSVSHDPDHPQAQLATMPIQVQLCPTGQLDTTTCPINHIPLSAVPDAGATVPGSEITFIAQALSSGLYLNNLSVVGGTAGAYIEHMLFVSLPASPAQPFPDQIDRYFATKLNVGVGMTSAIDGGTEDFIGFASTDMLQVNFKVLSPYKPETSVSAPTGCKVLATFKTAAVPQLGPAPGGTCSTCHGGQNTTATAAMDLSSLASTNDAMLINTCNQVRSRINFQTTDQSGFYLAPNPAAASNHPFNFNKDQNAFNAFKTAMDVWVKAEQTAP